jgi:hypothetical protein
MIESIIPLIIVVTVTAFIYHEFFYSKKYIIKQIENNSAFEIVELGEYIYFVHDKRNNKYYKFDKSDFNNDKEISKNEYLTETKAL